MKIWIRVSSSQALRIKCMDHPRGGYKYIYIGQSINSEPSDQTNSHKQHRCNLGGSGEPTLQWEANRAVPQADRPACGTGRPHLVGAQDLLWWRAFWSLPTLFVLQNYVISFDE